jgi:uncharacterized membrane protein
MLAAGFMLAAAAAAAAASPANAASLLHLRAAPGRTEPATAQGPAWPARASAQFRTVDVPGAAWTAVNGVNNKGTIVGTWVSSPGGPFGFGYIEQPGAQPATFNFPATSDVTASSGVNDVGTAVGAYLDSSGVPHGWVRSPHGNFTQLDDPSGVGGTSLFEINDAGVIVGGYTDGSGAGHGFVYDHGTFTTLDFPGALGTALTGVNNSGAIVGGYTDALGVNHGFLYRHGAFTTIDAPDAGTAPGQGTPGLSISSSGVIDGFVINDSGGGFFGWLLSKGQFSSFDEPDAPLGQSVPLNISSNGRYVPGEYFDTSGVLHGYVAALTPCGTTTHK